jgi:transposase
MSFDEGCTRDGGFPTAESVATALDRLAQCRQRLDSDCEKMVEEGVVIAAPQAFVRAGLVGQLNLLAPRLGLTGLVEEYAVRQVQRLIEEGAHAWQHPTPLQEDQLERWRKKRARRRAVKPADRESWGVERPTDLTDEEWRTLQALLPTIALYGMSERILINAILAVLCGGRGWRSAGRGLLVDAYRYCNLWRGRGMWEALRLALREPRTPFTEWPAPSAKTCALP